jgi:hypothetical protein
VVGLLELLCSPLYPLLVVVAYLALLLPQNDDIVKGCFKDARKPVKAMY